jgi:hypothetical protein
MLADRERVRQRLALELAAGAGVAATLLATQQGSWLLGSGKLAAWLKGATVAASLTALGTGAAYYLRQTTPPPPATQAQVSTPEARVTAVAPKLPLAQKQQEVAAPAEDKTPEAAEVAPTAKLVGASTTNKASSRASSDTLEAELKLIGQAQKALTSGQPNEALRALDEHQRKFPAGALSFERAGVRTVALCQSGRLREGRAAARSYLRNVPNSVLSKRIRVACQLVDE